MAIFANYYGCASETSSAAYVDLNPIRAAMAQTLEHSDFTSVQRRIEAMQEGLAMGAPQVSISQVEAVPESVDGSEPKTQARRCRDAHLAPLTIDELRDALGACDSTNCYLASDKGFLPMSVASYV